MGEIKLKTRIKIEKVMVSGVEVDAKKCTKCGVVKELSSYYKKRVYGLEAICISCKRIVERERNNAVRHLTLWTTDSYANEVSTITEGKYSVLGDYKRGNEKLAHRHNECGLIYEVKPSMFLVGRRCPKCHKTARKSTDGFREEVYRKCGQEYSVIGEYKNSKSKLLLKHNECGNNFLATPSSFLGGHGCSHCSGNLRKDTEKFKAEMLELVGDEYKVQGEYKNTHAKIKIEHVLCGKSFSMSPRSFLSGQRCPKCKESRGESVIAELLDVVGVGYWRQFKFDRCVSKRKLPFDFALVSEDERPIAVIEYDGRQHYDAIEAWGGFAALKRTRRHDAIKTEYCRANGIPLIRIPYWDYDNIEAILTEKLTELGVIS